MDAFHKEMRMNSEKFEALQGTLVSCMDIHQAREEAIQEERLAKMDAHEEKKTANMNAWQEGIKPV
jgi:hypothetical protein